MLNIPSCSRPEHSSGQHALCCEDRFFKVIHNARQCMFQKTWTNERRGFKKMRRNGRKEVFKTLVNTVFFFFFKYLQISDEFALVQKVYT